LGRGRSSGRRIRGCRSKSLLREELPDIVDEAVVRPPLEEIRRFVECIENQEDLRSRLGSLGLIAFVGDGSPLPRESGASDQPTSHAESQAVCEFRNRIDPSVSQQGGLKLHLCVTSPTTPNDPEHSPMLIHRRDLPALVG
jgi:hypothetical protein